MKTKYSLNMKVNMSNNVMVDGGDKKTALNPSTT